LIDDVEASINFEELDGVDADGNSIIVRGDLRCCEILRGYDIRRAPFEFFNGKLVDEFGKVIGGGAW